MAGAGRGARAGDPARGGTKFAKGLRRRAPRSLRPALAACAGALALGAAAARGAAAFSAGAAAAPPRGAAGRLGAPAAAGRAAVRRQSTAAFLGSACDPPSGFPGSVPDPVLHGKLRSLGRLLLIAGRKLEEASSRRAAWLDSSAVVSEHVLHVSGAALRGAAEALLKDRWDRARQFLRVARSQVKPLFLQEQLAPLQGMLSGSPALVDATAALAGLGRTLERQAERVGEACSCLDGAVCAPLEDAFFDAAGALSAAARLFDKSPRAASADAGATAAAAAPAATPFAEVERALAAASSPEQRRAALKELAKRLHPDRHPGREAEVLAAFRHVQELRSEERWLQNRWGA